MSYCFPSVLGEPLPQVNLGISPFKGSIQSDFRFPALKVYSLSLSWGKFQTSLSIHSEMFSFCNLPGLFLNQKWKNFSYLIELIWYFRSLPQPLPNQTLNILFIKNYQLIHMYCVLGDYSIQVIRTYSESLFSPAPKDSRASPKEWFLPVGCID